ncbi:hypothetical protein [Demequina sp.]|uniref:hypothetical protein n=1 Tax=Demequina sp. TaxID=2050685 RepID=UPI003A89A18F
MITALIVVGVLALVAVAALVWWARSERGGLTMVDLDRQWTEMQIEQLGREARARMRAAVDEARAEQQRDRLS